MNQQPLLSARRVCRARLLLWPTLTRGVRLGFAASLAFLLTTDSATSAPPTVPPPAEFCGTMQAWMASPQGKEFSRRASLTGTCPTQGACDNPANRDAAIPNGSTPVKLVRLRFQVLANDDGSNVAVTPAEIAAQVDKLNTDFEASRIQFVYSIRTNLSTLYRNCPSNAEPAMKAAFSENPAQQLNVFVTRYTFGSCGIATFPFSPSSLTSTGGMLLQDWAVAPARTGNPASFFGCASHEMGHMLGLVHTFRGTTEWTTDCQNCKELAGRNTFDGDRTGDYCSDTAPDPGLTITTAPCNPTGTDSCNTQPYTNIDTLNIMSYYIGCQSRFTPQQMGRMHCWIGSSLSSTYFFDAVNPGVAVLTPTNGTVATSVSNATGTASDDNAVKRVRVALARTADGAWWDWTNGVFSSATFDFVPHTAWANGTTAWTKTLPVLPSGAYQVHAQSIDLADRASAWQLNQFTIDTSSPTIAFSPLTNQQVVFNFDQLGGTISEAATVKFKIEWFKAGGNEFWNGVNWSSSAGAGAELAANVAGLNWTPAPGTLPSRAQLAPGNYVIHAYVTDAAGNTNDHNLVLSRSPLDTTPPLASINLGEGEVFTNNFLPALQGLAGDAESGVDLVTMYFARRVPGGFEYWNGSSWSASSSAITLSYQDFVWGMSGGTPQPSGANLRNGSYNIQVIARNREVPALSGSVSVNFVVDWHPVYIWTAGSFSDGDPNNNNNNWDNPANWSPYGLPPAEASVFINGNPEARPFAFINVHGLTHSGGTLYSSNLNVKFLTQHGGRIHCENILQLGNNGVFRWNGGEFYGGAAKLGSFNVPTNGTVIISNTPGKAVYSATFNNSGTVRWFEGHIYGDESVMNNGPTGLWEASGPYALNLYPNFGAGNRGFVNHGTFRKIGAVETAHQGVFINHGTIETLDGLFTIYDAMRWENGSSLTGTGTVQLVNGCCGATATVAGGVTLDGIFDLAQSSTFLRGMGHVNLTSNGVLRLSQGYVGGQINFSGPGQINWTSGGFDGTNALNTTVNVSGPEWKWFNRAGQSALTVVNNQGIINWSGPGGIHAWSRGWNGEQAPILNNTGTIRFLADGVPFARNGEYPALNNLGKIIKSGGTNETTFHSFRLNNQGAIVATAGTLALVDEVSFASNSILDGQTLIRFAGAITASNTISASGSFRLDGGWFNSVTNANGAPLSAWLGTNTFEWLGGTMWGHLVLGTNVTFNISDPASPNTKFLGPRATIDNHGLVNWSGAGRIHAWARSWYGEYPSTFNNKPGATFRLLNDGYPFGRDGDYSFFTNHPGSLFVKMGGTNRTTIDSWVFANSGEVRANAGALEFSDVSVLQPGALFRGAGRHLISSGTHTLFGTNTIDGTTLQHSGGTIVCNSNSVATFRTINNGLLNWSGGALVDRLAWAPGSTVHITGPATKVFGSGAVLDNSAYVRWEGSGHIWNQARSWYAEFPATWNNLSGSMLDVWEDAAFSHDGTPSAFNNFIGATFRKTGGANTIVYWLFNNSGALQSYAGRIEFAGGGVGSGTFFADAGGKVKFTGGNYTLAGAALTGAGLQQIDGATVTTLGNVTVGIGSPTTLELLSGSLNGGGTLGGNANINWAGGTIGGTQQVASGAVFNVTGANQKYLAGGTVLNNAGIVNWSGPGDIHAWSRGWNGEAPSTINNLAGGQFRFLTEGAPFVRNGDYCYFNNHGTLWKAGGTNETTVHSFIVNNFGHVLAQIGALAFVDYVNLGSNTTLQGESRIRFAGFVTASNNVMASGVVRVDGGWFNAEINTNGTPRSIWAGTNTLEWMGGTLFGHHTFGSNVIVNIADPASGPVTKFLGSFTTINNHGQMNWSGAARIHAWARSWYSEGPSLFNNLPGATFRFLNDGYPFARDGDYSRFTNYAGGLVVKRAGTNKTTIDSWQFANAGEIRADAGTIEFSDVLHLQNGGSLSGPGTNVIGAGSHTVQGMTTLNGVMRISDGTVTGSSNATFLAGSGSLEWLGGWFAGNLTLGSGLETTVSGGSTKALGTGSVLRNRGRFRWTGAGDLWSPARSWYGELPASIYNESGGVFTAENNAAFTTWGSANYFHNMEGALFMKTNGIDSTACNWFFTNSGTLELCSGVLALNINPTALAGGTVNVWAGGTTPASGYAQLALAGDATLVGALNLKLRAGYAPALADSFNPVTYGSRTAQFAPVNTPPIENDLLWLTSYGANAFTLAVGRAFVATAPTRLSNGHFEFSLRGPEATRAVIEASEDLQTWLPIMTNEPFNGLFLFDDPGAVTRSNRFYRVRIVP